MGARPSQYDVARTIVAALRFERHDVSPEEPALEESAEAAVAAPAGAARRGGAGRRRAQSDDIEQLLDDVRERGLLRDPEFSEVVRRILELVSAGDAALLRARYLEGKSADELAERAGISAEAVDDQLAWARARLQDELAQRLDLVEGLGERIEVG